MKYIYIILAVIVAYICTDVFYLNNKGLKTAYVDNAKLLNEYEGMLDARARYQDKAKDWDANIDTLSSSFQEMLVAYEKKAAGMGKEARKKEEELLNQKKSDLLRYQKATADKAKEEEAALTTELINEVNIYIKQYGKENGYTYIFGANSSGNIVYADNAKDITDEIVAEMNTRYKSKKSKQTNAK